MQTRPTLPSTMKDAVALAQAGGPAPPKSDSPDDWRIYWKRFYRLVDNPNPKTRYQRRRRTKR